MSLLANLLVSAPAEVFDNDAMALVLRVLWKQYIRRYYYIDFCIYITYYICWIVLVETATILSPSGQILIKDVSTLTILVPVVVMFNTIFAAKEITEGIYGMKFMYWRSWWNASDWMVRFCCCCEILFRCTAHFCLLGNFFLCHGRELFPCILIRLIYCTPGII